MNLYFCTWNSTLEHYFLILVDSSRPAFPRSLYLHLNSLLLSWLRHTNLFKLHRPFLLTFHSLYITSLFLLIFYFSFYISCIIFCIDARENEWFFFHLLQVHFHHGCPQEPTAHGASFFLLLPSVLSNLKSNSIPILLSWKKSAKPWWPQTLSWSCLGRWPTLSGRQSLWSKAWVAFFR